MKIRGIAVMLLAVAWAGGGEAQTRTPEARERTNRCYTVRVEAVSSEAQASTNRRRYRRRFMAHELLDLELSVWLPASSDAALVEIHLFTPNGRRYEVLRATADRDATERNARYRGRRSRVMSARLPVAGSHITGRSLYGTWRAEVFLDGNEKGCTRRPTEFTIDP